MITVAQAAEKIISRSRYLNEAMSKNLINLSSLARYIKPELEEMVFHTVSDAAILMALTRLQKTLKPIPQYNNIFAHPPEVTLRSQLGLVVFDSACFTELSSLFLKKYSDTYFEIHHNKGKTCLLTSLAIVTKLSMPHQNLIWPVAAITITLPSNALNTPGAFYFFLKSVAWENISVVEIFTLRESFTIVVGESDAHRTFEVIETLFSGKSEIF